MTQKTTGVRTEHLEQIDFVNAFRATYPQYLIFAVPNGELRNVRVAKRLKQEGVLAGVPDLIIVIPNKTIFLEMKRSKGGRVSPTQKQVHSKLAELGFEIVVGFGAKDAWEKILKLL